MASSSLTSCHFIPFSSFNPSRRRHLRRPFSISCGSVDKSEPPDRRTANQICFKLLELSVTLTVVSSSLSLSPAIAATAKTSGKKKKSTKTEALSPEELKSWSRDLPTVTDRIPYTEILNLKQEGKLKHIINHPCSNLMLQSESVLVVLDDLKVLRTVLPSVARDPNFWDAWDELNLNSVCINVYTPPVHVPVMPLPYPGFLSNLPKSFMSLLARRKPPPKSKRALELERARKKLVERREAMQLREQMMKKATRAKKREVQKKRDREQRKARHEQTLRQAEMNTKQMSATWYRLAHDQNFSTGLGIVFFYIFYRTVVLSYRKNQKDYEDRLKIESAEAEERRKIKQLERELAGLEPYDEEDENEGSEKEKDPYREIMKFMKSGARVHRAEPRKLPQYLDKTLDVKFSDVAGLGELRMELEEIVKFFTHGDVYRRRGVKIPGGILLCGAPGVGKTLLAKAVAGEAGVNFFSISASQFVEIYVGVGASRVRALYQEAKEFAPSVVFIDELDAVGRKRGMTSGSGGQERDATLNQLLVCLDGFEGKGNVITIAATNRPDILDQALVRPGRFDRKIYIPKPSLLGRMGILKVHARNKPMADDIDYAVIASATEGMAGAELANIVEVAAMNMIHDGRSEITTDDLLQAAEMEERGMLDKKDRSPEQWRRMALNETSMAVVALNFRELKNVEFITIAPRAGDELGYVRVRMDYIKFQAKMFSRQSALDYITVQLAPRAAEEIWFGEDKLSTMSAEITDNARSAARSFVLYGLSTKYYGLADFWTADRLNEIDSEALHILNICYDRAKQILMRNQKLVDAVADELFQKKNIAKQEFFQLVEAHGNLEPLPPDIISLTMAKRAEFQEMMMSKKEASTSSSS